MVIYWLLIIYSIGGIISVLLSEDYVYSSDLNIKEIISSFLLSWVLVILFLIMLVKDIIKED